NWDQICADALIMMNVIGIVLSALLAWPALAQQAAQTYTLDGQVFSDTSGTTPLAVSGIQFTLQILDPTQTCILYEENQTVDTSATNGDFTVQVGSATSAGKRGTNDVGNAMATVYSNTI